MQWMQGPEAMRGTEVDIRLDREKRQIQAWLDEKQIGRITVVPVGLDWGRGTVVPMGGIAGVGTEEAYRGLGIARRMMERATAFSREQGYPVGGVSTGCSNVARRLYARSGYVYLFSIDQYEKPVSRPEPARPPDGAAVRPYAAGDEAGILELLNRSYSAQDFFGGRSRDASEWVARRTALLTADPQSVWVAVRNGTVVGWAEYYFHWGARENCALLVEESEDAADVARALLTRLERSLADAALTRLTFHASRHQTRIVDSLLKAGCRRRAGCVFQVAIFDLPDLLSRLRPLYVERLRSSQLDEWPGVLRVEMGEQAAEIELPGGAAGRRVEINGPYETIVRVLCGRDSAWQAYLRGHLQIVDRVDQDSIRALNAILGQYPWYHPLRDRW